MAKKINDELKYNATEKSITEKMTEKLNSGDKISDLLNGVEIKPNSSFVLVKPYKKNPYERVEVTASGIVLDDNFVAKNEQTGEEEEIPAGIIVARVIEIGPDVKFVKEDDDVYYYSNSSVPIPFFRQGLQCVAESRILMVINKNLSSRKAND